MSDQDQNQGENPQAESVDLFQNKQDPEPSQQQSAPQAAVTQQTDSYQELLSAITNESGEPKYKNVSEALVGASHAQEHIRRLEAELAQAKTEQQRVDIASEIRDALKPQQGATPPPQGDQVDIRDVVAQVMDERTQAQRKADNRAEVNSVMAQKFGDKAMEVVTQKAAELGVSPDFLKSIGESSPKAFLEYFDAKPVGTPATQLSSTQNNAAPQPSNEGGLPKAPDNIMMGASTKDLVNHWQAVKEYTNKRLTETQ